MCGAHNSAAPEGITRHVKTIGEVEPCKLAIKAVAPMRKFVALKEFIQRVDNFVNEIKGKVVRLSGIYERSDVMFSIYPGNGARFANHVDNTTMDGRILTVVAYLNPGWEEDWGGSLRIQKPEKYQTLENSDKKVKEYTDVFPQSGRIAMFYSSEVPHEVCPTWGREDRHACTIWYYDMEERKEAVKAAVDAGRGAEAAVAGIEAQTEARSFIAELMGKDKDIVDGSSVSSSSSSATPASIVPTPASGSSTSSSNDGDSDGSVITVEMLEELNRKVQNEISPEALKIVASITGRYNRCSWYVTAIAIGCLPICYWFGFVIYLLVNRNCL